MFVPNAQIAIEFRDGFAKFPESKAGDSKINGKGVNQ